MTTTRNTDLDDTEVADAIVDVPEEEGVTEAEAYRTYALKAQAYMREQAKAAERTLKGLYSNWVLDVLNLNKNKPD